MNQPNLEALHDIAMEFAEEANFANKRGEKQVAKLFYQKAFNLEKTYALSFPATPAYLLSRAVFLRSAAYLALNSGHAKEAKEITIQGLLTSADLSNKQIKVKDKVSEQVYIIHVSNISLEELVHSFWAKSVFIKGITDKEGAIQLAEIKRVA